MSLFLFIINNMNNPKIDFIFELLNEDSVECDILMIEYSDKEAKMNCFDLSKSKKSLKEIKIPTTKFCFLISLLLKISLYIGTEDMDSIYNSNTHQKLISAKLDLPNCLLILQYEDQIVQEIISNYIEDTLRNNFRLE